VVADPNYAPMYATRSRRTKTDRRDARTLMDACQTGAYRLAHLLSDPRRHVRAELAVRDALVRTRTRYVALAKTLVRRDGLRVASSESHLVAQRISALSLSPALAAELQPLFTVLAPLNEQIAAADGRIARLAATDPLVARLATAPAIGPVTAMRRRRHGRRHYAVPLRAPVRSLPGLGTGPAELGGKASRRAHYEGGQQSRAMAVGRSGLAPAPDQVGRGGRAPGLGALRGGAAREADCGRRPRAATRGGPLRHVAGRGAL